MTTTLPHARFSATNLAHDRFVLLGIDINIAIDVVRNSKVKSSGKHANEHWYQGETPDGRTLNVLVASPYPTIATIILVTEITEGGT